MKKIITIGIPVYNEEANIKNVLDGILLQKVEGFVIDSIIVISDGSTDRTVEKVKEVTDKRIKLYDFKERKGKSFYMNYLFKEVETEILVMLDGDVILSHNLVIRNIIRPIIQDKKVGLTSGDFQPIKIDNFLQKAIKSTVNVYEVVRHEWKGGNNALGCTGRVMALSKDCYKSIHIPDNMVLNDIYTYFACLRAGFEFRHVKEATVYYQLPNKLADHLSQSVRSEVGVHRISRVFGKLYTSEYALPKKRFWELTFKEFINNPIGCVFICLLNKFAKIASRKEIDRMNAKWEMATSTKKLTN